MTSEYASRTITATLAAVPRRLPLVGAKAGVVGVVVFLAALGAVLVAVLGAAALLATAGAPVPAVGPTLARLVVGSALFLTVTAVLGVGFGWLLRSTAGALAGLYAFLFLPSALGLVVPAALPYLPGNAGTAILQVGDGALPPWAGLGALRGVRRGRPRGRRDGPRPSRRVTLMTAVTPTRHRRGRRPHAPPLCQDHLRQLHCSGSQQRA